jgi:hypothetical protein
MKSIGRHVLAQHPLDVHEVESQEVWREDDHDQLILRARESRYTPSRGGVGSATRDGWGWRR